jgi:hypothetical protein
VTPREWLDLLEAKLMRTSNARKSEILAPARPETVRPGRSVGGSGELSSGLGEQFLGFHARTGVWSAPWRRHRCSQEQARHVTQAPSRTSKAIRRMLIELQGFAYEMGSIFVVESNLSVSQTRES